MRKLVFLVLIALFAVLAGWVAQRPAFHYLSDLRSSLALDLTTTPAAATTGNLLGIEPELVALDYGNPERLRLKLDAYLANARRLGLIGAQTIVVLPEHLGTPLALMGEKPEVYAAAQSKEAIEWLVLGNPLRVARAWFQSEGDRRLADSLLRMKAWDMASAYQQLFAGLAREYGVTLVAGSIVLPGPALVDGELQVGSGPLRNVTLVFGPDGKPLGEPLVRPLTASEVGDDLSPPLLRLDTPLGRLGVIQGSDTGRTGVLDAPQVDLLAIPALASGATPAPAPFDPQRLRAAGIRAALEVHLRGRLWEWQASGPSQAFTPDGESATDPARSGSKLLNLRL
ncbi:carbon-nitrogen hydrolase family protein [Pseudomonas oryzihabitans]|uniref:carbon-nitrogen hydrolase family protein n=1 Tax=Pseudomonas oryzihabitans TaxID=47885 RepID=UPI002B1E61E2|nr:carbon-nitrogen hydrolase family protein [Pseudomonas oryzihabitans]